MWHASALSLPIAREAPRLIWAALLAGCAAACLLGLYVGPGDLSDPALRAPLLELRACRVATAFLSGAALAVAGVLAQAVFHNPLASPSVLGVTSGAALGGKLGLLAHALLFAGASRLPVAPDMLVPVGCMGGALLSLLLLSAIARRIEGRVALLLAGFLLSSLFLSLGSFVITVGQGQWELGRALIGFTLGGVGGAGPRQVLLVLPIAVIGTAAALSWSRSLDTLLSGETEASALGVDTRLAKRCCIGWCALLSAGAVCVGGNVMFVGLIVPHALRPLLGVAHGPLVPASALLGGAFLVLCDVLARLAPSGGELPLGVITGLVGAPLFFVLLARSMPRG